ncbi:MAG: DUF45 domain-containing protein [Botrimarina sp.]
MLDGWYRDELRAGAVKLIEQWEPKVGVSVGKLFVQRMKTRWGSCNSKAKSIRLKTDLAKKPLKCLEHLVVHEMVHIIEPTHNATFQSLMRRHMPDWEHRRRVLNDLPVRHADWAY